MQTELLLTSVQQRQIVNGVVENSEIPNGAIRIHGQSAAGEHVSIVVTDPAEVAQILAVWVPYSVSVGIAIDQGNPWPAAPRLALSLSLILPYVP